MTDIFFSYAGSDVFNTAAVAHAHRGVELLYIFSGECDCKFLPDGEFRGRPGCVLLIPAHLFHERRIVSECKSFYVVFEKSDDSFCRVPRMIDTGRDALVEQWFQQLEKLNGDYETEQAAGVLYALLRRLEKIEKRNRHAENVHPGILKVREYIESHYQDASLSVSELARYAGFSQSHLNAIWRQTYGHGVLHFLTGTRMRAARRLLLNYYYNRSEVAQLCGIPDAAYFAQCFRNYHGVTPTQYRNDPAVCSDRPDVLGK